MTTSALLERPTYTGNRLTVHDFFCGAGGSSEGAEWAGAEVIVAANHWQKAIDVHQSRHPNTRHDCADITQVDFRRYPSADILMASPECTNHANAKGVSRKKQDANLFNQDFDPAAERSRATMWDVVRATECMAMRGTPYKAIVVENVVEATSWNMWPAWLMAMLDPVKGTRYKYRVLSHNSMHHGVPQSRDRIYVVFWLEGLAPDLELELSSWCDHCQGVTAARQAFRPGKRVGKYKRQYHYCCTSCHQRVTPPTNPALSIIDFAIPMTQIKDRKKPLAAATMRRIETGIERYGPYSFVHQAAGNVYQREGSTCRSKPLDEPLGAQTTTTQHALIDPGGGIDPGFMVQTGHGGGKGRAFEHRTTGLGEPHPTVTASDDRQMLVTWPFMVQGHGKDSPSRTRPVSDPAYTATASGVPALVVPEGIDMAFGTRNHGDLADAPDMPYSLHEPVPTMTTAANQSLIVHMRNHGKAVPAVEPMNTVSAGGNHQGLLVPYYGKGVASSTASPAPTVTTRDRLALVLDQDEVNRTIDAMECWFRMLDPSEVAAAMAFPTGYIPTEGYTKRDRVRLAGNAVTPPVMAWVISRLMQAIEVAA